MTRLAFIEIAEKFAARIDFPRPMVPVVIQWSGNELVVDAVELGFDPEAGTFELNWSDAGSTAPVLSLPENWDGSRFAFGAVNPDEPEGDMGPISDEEDSWERTAGYCRIASPALTEELVDRGGDSICLVNDGTEPGYEVVDDYLWDR